MKSTRHDLRDFLQSPYASFLSHSTHRVCEHPQHMYCTCLNLRGHVLHPNGTNDSIIFLSILVRISFIYIMCDVYTVITEQSLCHINVFLGR